MDDLIAKLMSVVPAKWHTTAVLLLAAVPLGGRAWHAWKTEGGLKGVWNAIVYGTNQPKQTENKQ